MNIIDKIMDALDNEAYCWYLAEWLHGFSSNLNVLGHTEVGTRVQTLTTKHWDIGVVVKFIENDNDVFIRIMCDKLCNYPNTKTVVLDVVKPRQEIITHYE